MTMLDDVVTWIIGEITTIGLSTSSDSADEISGGGYAALEPAWESVSGGAVDLSATLEFSGPANAGPVTHLIFRNASGVWVVRPVTGSSASFNSDGKLNLTSAPITAAFAS